MVLSMHTAYLGSYCSIDDGWRCTAVRARARAARASAAAR
eukprot:SAG31_NODE_23036_length_512_cov_9.811138_1_plen_39_part_01